MPEKEREREREREREEGIHCLTVYGERLASARARSFEFYQRSRRTANFNDIYIVAFVPRKCYPGLKYCFYDNSRQYNNNIDCN